MSSPDFLCIGAPKAGTTWLYDNLSLHPQVWLPPTKSIQFFTGGVNRRRFRKLVLGIRNQGVNRGNARFSLRDDWATFAWKLRYYMWPFTNLNWYCSLFPDLEGRIGGEIAPSYTGLSIDRVASVHSAAPHAKLIFFMRNPVERAWSHFMLSYIKSGRKQFDSLSSQAMIDILDHPPSMRLSNYRLTLDSWRQYYPDEQMLICFFDEIEHDPEGLMRRLCDFLQIAPDLSLFEESSRRNIFKGVKNVMPDEVKLHLCRVFLDQLISLEQEFGSYPAIWRQQASHILQDASPADVLSRPEA